MRLKQLTKLPTPARTARTTRIWLGLSAMVAAFLGPRKRETLYDPDRWILWSTSPTRLERES